MFKYLSAALIAVLLTACGGHPDPSDPLAGTWGVKVGDAVKPFLKLEKNGDQYVVFDYKGGNWQRLNEHIKPMTSGDLAKLTGQRESDGVLGVQANTFAFFHVPVGWSVPGFATQTGYVIFVPIKLVDLQRISS